MSQQDAILALLSDGNPHRTDEIVSKVYGEGMSLARVGARIFDLKGKGHVISGWKDKERPSLYWYKLDRPAERGVNERGFPRVNAPVSRDWSGCKQISLFTETREGMFVPRYNFNASSSEMVK